MPDEDLRKGIKKIISILEGQKEKGRYDYHFKCEVVMMEPDFDKVLESQDVEENTISKIREVVNLKLAQELAKRYGRDFIESILREAGRKGNA